ncbi:MAG: SDR family NAD(P)-dependent oxidoreductase [Alphaproteobacteria bacterium]|nr:SDR family NAD(P)-dependent oxidoreductase [Alphaproteobacteria bacterium]
MLVTDLPLADRVALVTGASRGIGFATAQALARMGAHVIACGRSKRLLEDLDDALKAEGLAPATLVPFDLRDFPAIDRLGQAIFERWGRLDVLVGNAGQLGQLGPIGHVKPDAWNELMEVNVTANWRLIRSMDPLLRIAETGRAVFVSSGAARRIRAYWGPYSVTKAALEALAKSYAAELVETHVRVNIFNPGPVRTAMRAKAMPGENPETLPQPAEAATELVKLCLPSCTAQGEIFDSKV